MQPKAGDVSSPMSLCFIQTTAISKQRWRGTSSHPAEGFGFWQVSDPQVHTLDTLFRMSEHPFAQCIQTHQICINWLIVEVVGKVKLGWHFCWARPASVSVSL